MKYYYTDPLAAAWMAKHFGMKFQKTHLPDFSFGDAQDIMDDLINHELGNFYGDGRYYIAPGNLHLLDPQAGDVLGPMKHSIKSYNQVGIVGGNLGYRAALKKRMLYSKIIQRNGIVFMWPEVSK